MNRKGSAYFILILSQAGVVALRMVIMDGKLNRPTGNWARGPLCQVAGVSLE